MNNGTRNKAFNSKKNNNRVDIRVENSFRYFFNLFNDNRVIFSFIYVSKRSQKIIHVYTVVDQCYIGLIVDQIWPTRLEGTGC
jgi:hypothetical protein